MISTYILISSEAGLAHDVSTPYEHDTEFNSKNETVRDAAWDSISIDPLVIAVTKDWAKDKGLTPSWDFPWDGNKQYYFLKVFHQLHCLVGTIRSFCLPLMADHPLTEPHRK